MRAAPSAQRSGTTPLITVFTPVHNTRPDMLIALAAGLLDQLEAGFEWLILDNGSSSLATLSCLQAIAVRPGVRLLGSEGNLGIVKGSRRCLEAAQGRYVVPVDHDDLLAPDALRTIREQIERHSFPAFLYSDGDKFDGAARRDEYFKPEFDPVLLVNSCYITHLAAFDRRLALELGVYEDPKVEGSQDWDAVLRFAAADHTPVHMARTLYTWRMHPASTAADIHSKPIVFESQKRALDHFLRARALPLEYRVGKSPLFGNSPDWWIRRPHTPSTPITTVVLRSAPQEPWSPDEYRLSELDHQVLCLPVDAAVGELHALLAETSRPDALVHLQWDKCRPDSPEWPWEAMSLLELFPDTAVVGGRIHAGNKILDAGRFFGFGWGCGCPDRGRDLQDPGYFAQMWKPHSVSAVSSQNTVFAPGFLGPLLTELMKRSVRLPALGEWAGAHARRSGRRVVYTPFLGATAGADFEALVTAADHHAFCSANADLFPESAVLSRRLALDERRAYRAATEVGRSTHLEGIAASGPRYAEWVVAEESLRRCPPPLAGPIPTFSWLTCVYEGTDGPIFRETADAVFEQSFTGWEWIVLAHGPVSAAVESELQALTRSERVTVLREPVNLGIIGGLRRCLEAAQGEFVVPLDADDIPTADALQVFKAAIDRHASPAFLYSDEDMLVEGEPRHPFFRPAWDPVLNVSTSFVLHLCAFRRARGLELGAYADDGVNYCHDWDTVTRFAAAGESPIHVPHVLYHWRAHPASTSNAGRQNPGSIASTRHLVEGVVRRQKTPSQFEVVAHPLLKYSVEWHVRRRALGNIPLEAIVLSTPGADSDVLVRELESLGLRTTVVPVLTHEAGACEPLRSAFEGVGTPWCMVVSDACEPRGGEWIWEAAKYPELFPDTALVGGRLLGPEGRVLGGGEVLDGDGRLFAPLAGVSSDDGGPFNLYFRSQTTAMVPSDFFAGATTFLREALGRAPDSLALGNLGAWLGACALRQGRRVVFSPLIEATAQPEHMIGYPADAETLAIWAKILDAPVGTGAIQGAAAFSVNGRRFHF